MRRPYTVALQGWPELPATNRIAAEVRFISEFERALGGLEGIAPAYAEEEEAYGALTGPMTCGPFTLRGLGRRKARTWRDGRACRRGHQALAFG